MGAELSRTTWVDVPKDEGSAGQLRVFAGELAKFRKRVDDLHDQLKKSSAGPTAFGERKVEPSAYGQGFPEAENLAAAYEEVLAQLKQFSDVFADQIETLGVGVDVAQHGYDSIDAEVKQRLAAIQHRTQDLYKAPRSQDQGAKAPAVGDGQSAGPDGI
ncbi:hypothetical protein [Streptomyces rimosus]|uniref:hypothetical protein n=1 Tax=Streptomyces rimosus TaxID=1927 RepID=UPI000B307D6E